MIDYAILDPDTTENAIREACKLAMQYKFKESTQIPIGWS